MKNANRVVITIVAITVILCTVGCSRLGKAKVADPWPTSALAKMIEQPDFGIMEIGVDADYMLSMNFENVDKADYNAYVEKCKMKFPVDPFGTSTSYMGEDENGYSIMVSYYDRGSGKMDISIYTPSEEDDDSEEQENENDDVYEAEKEIDAVAEEEDYISDDVTDAEETYEKEQESNVDSDASINPDLKAFLDSYEEFVDEYCVFMKKYYKADITEMMNLTTEYTRYCQRLTELEETLNECDSTTMTSAEALYYTEVMLRCSEKLQKTIQ